MVKNVKIIENIVGGLVFLIAFATFFSTVAPTTSFWDCGEYIAASYTLGIPHPPGNPLYVLIARLFTIIFSWTQQVAFRINLLSVITASITAFFLFKIIVLSMKGWIGELDEKWKIATINIAGFVGALFGVFNYTFWFSAVESSVYIPSILTIVLNVYIMLIWANSKEANRDKYLVLFAYLAFLGIGLHMMAMFAMFPIFLYILLVDKTKLKDWRLWGVGLLLGSVMYSMAAFFFVVPVLLVMSAIYSFVPKEESKIISPFVGAVTLFALYKLLVDPKNGDDIAMLMLVSVALIVFAVVNAMSEDKDSQKKWKFAFLIVLFSVFGFSVHTYIPIRSALEPMIDENHPVVEFKKGKIEWDAFRGFLERKQYGTESMITRMFHRRGAWNTQFGIDNNMGYGGFHITQFFHFGESIGIDRSGSRHDGEEARKRNSVLGEGNFLKRAGILFLYLLPTIFMLWAWKYWYKKDPKRTVLFVSLFLITTIAMVLYMNFSDGFHTERTGQPVHREVRERDYFFTPGFMFLGVWMGLAVGALLHFGFTCNIPNVRKRLMPVLAVLFIVSPALPFTQNYSQNNRANDWIPYYYAYNLLMSCEKDGIIFTNGDNDTFPLWFLQEAEGIRKDVRVVNLSLANTYWYLKQLLRLDPKVPMSYSESDFDSQKVTYRRNENKEPRMRRLRKAKIDIALPTAKEIPIWHIHHQLIIDIIDANMWQKPIYFSSTVDSENWVGFEPYLRFEGLAYRVVPQKTDPNNSINFERTKFLLDEVYQFGNMGDNSSSLSQTAARRSIMGYFRVFYIYTMELAGKIDDLEREKGRIDMLLATEPAWEEEEAATEFKKQKEKITAQQDSLSDEIIEKMSRCVSLMPWDERPRTFLVNFLLKRGKIDLARRHLDEGLSIEPKNVYYRNLNEKSDFSAVNQ
ncbi:MAG: DUF2723 domain-containing protein [Chitinivibrionia bacterium]|nr:DUF2723 domain-containing protein [Chitinivibrionia bacterium]